MHTSVPSQHQHQLTHTGVVAHAPWLSCAGEEMDAGGEIVEIRVQLVTTAGITLRIINCSPRR